MADQKASKYYAAEEEAQMKKVCAFLAMNFELSKRHKNVYVRVVANIKLTAQFTGAQDSPPHQVPRVARPRNRPDPPLWPLPR